MLIKINYECFYKKIMKLFKNGKHNKETLKKRNLINNTAIQTLKYILSKLRKENERTTIKKVISTVI